MAKNRLLALLLALLLCLTASVALGESVLNPVGELPLTKTPQKFSILLHEQTLVENYETNAYTKYLEDTLGIDIEFNFLPASGPADKLAVMISSGQALPDVVCYPLDLATTYNYAKAGAFIALDEYIEKYSVNVAAKDALYPELNILNNLRTADGHIYSLPYYASNASDEVCYKLWINQKWLDKLGLAMPTTTEEFYNVLTAFKTQDPNGNGKADEYPLVGSTGWSQDATVPLMNAFVFDDNTTRFNLADGTLSVAYNQDGWKEGLTYLNRLVKDELLSPLTFTQTQEQLQAMVNNEGDCIVGVYCYATQRLLAPTTASYEDYIHVPPLTGPSGVRYAAYNPTVPLNYWFVTADCKNPELAFRIGDFLFDEEVMMRNRFGVEGEQWTRATEEETKASGSTFAYYQTPEQDIFTIAQNVTWRGRGSHFFGKPMAVNLYSVDPRYNNATADYVAARPQAGSFVPPLVYSDEELEAVPELKSTLITMVNENKALFITGARSLEADWNAYLAELEQSGLASYLSMSQAAYDRMYK